MKEQSSLKNVRNFLGFKAYYIKFIPIFGKTTEQIYGLIKNSNKFELNTKCKFSVTKLKTK